MKKYIIPVVLILLFLIASCEKEDSNPVEEINPLDEGEIVDFEGNIYETVKIGDQWWMAENLKSTHTSNGIEISGIYAYNNDESNVNNYGRLYAYEAANSNFIEGWHLPSDEEWNILEETLGSDVAIKLKEGGSSGFEAKLAGYKYYVNAYDHIDIWGIFWTCTPYTDDHSFVRNLFSYNNDFVRSGYGNIGAVSVRLIKD